MKPGWKLEWGRKAEVESRQQWGPPVSLPEEAEVDVRNMAREARPRLGGRQDEGTDRISQPHILQSLGNDGANDRVLVEVVGYEEKVILGFWT